MKMKVSFISQSFPFNHNLISWMSAITSERYNKYGKTLFLIKIVLLKHFALEVCVSIWTLFSSKSTNKGKISVVCCCLEWHSNG